MNTKPDGVEDAKPSEEPGHSGTGEEEAEARLLRAAEVLHSVMTIVEGHGQAIAGAVPLAELRAGAAVREWMRVVTSSRRNDR